jgi:hypothetical protein
LFIVHWENIHPRRSGTPASGGEDMAQKKRPFNVEQPLFRFSLARLPFCSKDTGVAEETCEKA